MRKLILTILLPLLSASIGYALSTDDEIVAKIFSEAGVDQTYDSDASELKVLSNEDQPFENLYLFMYQNIKEAPKKAAIEETALKIGYSEEDLEKVISDKDISVIQDYLDEASSQNQEIISEEFAEISSIYQNELEFQTENRRLLYETLASEIFVNNDLSDSAGVDLLYDLNLIHKLLFGEDIEFPERGGDEEVQLASEELFEVSLLKVKREAEKVEDSEAMMCIDDEELTSAIEEFESSNNGQNSSSSSSSSSSSNSSSNSSSSNSSQSSDRESLEEFVAGISGKLGNWDRELPCDEIFCITVNLVSETDESSKAEDSYEETENCIACHISYILERMEQTTSESLVPSRVTTNFFEDATCKEAGIMILPSMHVYAIPKPIPQDPGDGIDENANKNAEDLENTLSILGANTDSEGGNLKSSSENDSERIINTHPNATFEEVVEANLEAIEVRQENIEEAFDGFMLRTRIENSIEMYSQVSSELSVLLSYFKTFEDRIEETYLGALTKLISDKEYCQ